LRTRTRTIDPILSGISFMAILSRLRGGLLAALCSFLGCRCGRFCLLALPPRGTFLRLKMGNVPLGHSWGDTGQEEKASSLQTTSKVHKPCCVVPPTLSDEPSSRLRRHRGGGRYICLGLRLSGLRLRRRLVLQAWER
jgi:hypothetical protein